MTRADLARLGALIGQDGRRHVSTKGRLTGPYTALRAAGDATLNQLEGFDVTALALDRRVRRDDAVGRRGARHRARDRAAARS